MRSDDIEIGDLVRLLSGGPTMTVCSDPHRQLGQTQLASTQLVVACMWFTDQGTPAMAEFPVEALMSMPS